MPKWTIVKKKHIRTKPRNCKNATALVGWIEDLVRDGSQDHVSSIIANVFSARCNIIHLALMLRCQSPSVCDGSALAHYRFQILIHLNFTRSVVAGRGNLNNNISRYASHC